MAKGEGASALDQLRRLGKDPLAQRLLAGIAVINLLVSAIVGFSLYTNHKHYDKQAEIWTQNTARILENNLVSVFDKFGIVLVAACRETRRQMAAGELRKEAMDTALLELSQGVPELSSLNFADAQGFLRYGKFLPEGAPVSIADRDYFRQLQQDPQAVTSVSGLIWGRLTGKANLFVARRLEDAQGHFAGVLFGSFEVGTFDQIFAHLEVGSLGAVGIRDQAFQLVALHPKGVEPGSQIGSNLVSETTRAMIQAHPVTATYKTTFARDHQERLVTFRRVAGYPFYIFATYSPRDYLVPWHLELAIAVALLAAFALATVVLARTILTSQTRELARMEAVRLGDAWQRQHEELQAALSRMKRLEGVIPICSYCKKIRTELKSWEQMEGYISEHSDAVFSHGVCPHCAQEQLRLFKEGNVQ